MSYRFEAEPKVVHSRAKYRITGQTDNGVGEEFGSSHPNLLKDNRIKVLTPAQQEEEYVRIEKDRIKIENMHKQLVAFKKSKKKVSPYDIKPSANPKVNVNLTFFLTDSTDTKPPQTNIDVQTDVFKEKPKSPTYVPKKTGRDVYTQVEDNELFNFDREVTPIIDVIVTKTLEQSIIEIEEEQEIHRIKQFKEGYWKRRQEDEQKWKAMLVKELETIASKDKKLEEYRLREEKRIRVLRKVQTYQIAKTYLRDLGFNTLSFLHNNGLYQNTQREELINKVPNFFIDGVIKTLTHRHNIKDMVAVAFNHIQGNLMALRESRDKQFKRKQEKRRVKRINNSKDERLARFMYADDTTPSSYFVRFLSKFQEQELHAYFDDYRARVYQLKEKLQNSEINHEEYMASYARDFPELSVPSNLRIVLNDLQVLSFNVANNMYYPYYPEPEKKDGTFDIAVSTFDNEGHFLYQIGKENVRNASKSIKYIASVRDSQAKISDDIGMKINLKKIEPEVSHLVLTVEIRSLKQSIDIFNDFLQYSRFRLADYITNQTIDDTSLFQNFKLDDLKDGNEELENLGAKILCYYLKRTPELGWVLESTMAFKYETLKDLKEDSGKDFKTESVKVFRNVTTDTYKEFNTNVVERYLKICLDEEFKEFGDTIDFTGSFQESLDRSKTKEQKSSNPASKPTSKQAIIEPKKEEEEGNFGVKFTTSTFGPLNLKVTDTVEEIRQKVDELLEKENPLLHKSFEYGYEILVDGHELVRPTQIRKIGAVTTFTLKRKPKPVEEVIMQTDGEDGVDGQSRKASEDY